MKNKLLKIINHFGINTQLRKLNEECFELIEAIRDYEDMYMKCDCDSQYLKYEKEHIEEELADVKVLLEQIKEYYQLDTDRVKNAMECKIDRTLERIASGYYK